MLCRHAQLTVGQSSTHSRFYGEQEDAFQRLTLSPSRFLHVSSWKRIKWVVKRRMSESCFLVDWKRPLYFRFTVRSVFFRCSLSACERVPAGLLCIPVSFLKSAIRGEQHVFFFFHKWSVSLVLSSRARINDNVTASSAVGGQGAGVSGPWR